MRSGHPHLSNKNNNNKPSLTNKRIEFYTPSFSPLAAVVSVESPLSCSAPSPAPNVLVDEAAGAAFGSEASEPDGFFVHWRAFFWKYRAANMSVNRI